MPPRHASKRPGALIWAVAIVAALVIGSAAATLALTVTGRPSAAGRHHGGGSSATGGASATTRPPAPAETVSSIAPAPGSSVAPDGTITVTLSQPLAAASPDPTLSPATAGTWSQTSPTTLVFDPSTSFVPGQIVTVIVPGGARGVVSTAGGTMAASTTAKLVVQSGSVMRLAQLLAGLGYLPLTFHPASTAVVPAQDEAIAQAGTYTWRWSTLPTELTSQWSLGTYNPIVRGAVMAFQDQHHLGVDGDPGPMTWGALLRATASQTPNDAPYDWVYVHTGPLPETVTVWSNGQPVYQTLANTGVPGATTAPGTFEVFDHIRVGTMTGKNLDGSTYVDPGIKWISYFDKGDALHAYPRATYGFPQSLGCVEMPQAEAQVVWGYTPLGTVVTVQ